MSARLSAPLCATLHVVHEAIEQASRVVVRNARLFDIEQDELPAADEDGDVLRIARLWRERSMLLAAEREEQDLRVSLRVWVTRRELADAVAFAAGVAS